MGQYTSIPRSTNMTSTTPAPVDCKECASTFPSFKTYIKHLMAKECSKASRVTAPSVAPSRKAKVTDKVPCTLCGKMCKNSRGLSMHMTTSHGCNYCDKSFADLPSHIESEHRKECCTECSMKFVTSSALKSHMTGVHLVNCPECPEYFYNPSTLAEHTREEHEEECDICLERFPRAVATLEAHQATEHGIKPRVVRQFAGGCFMLLAE